MLPLFAERDLAAPLVWHRGQPISAGRFLAEATALAERLPAGRPVNLCRDRYCFALGLAAALLRGQTSVLPPNALPDTLRQVPAESGRTYLLTDDDAVDAAGLHRVAVAVSRPRPGLAPLANVPVVDAGLDAVWLLTSGSTGAPTAHGKQFGTLVANIAAAAERLAGALQRPSLAGLAVVATVPAQHSYGLESTVLLALLGGASFDSGRPFYPADIAEALAAVPSPRALVTTPFHLKTLLQSGVTLPPVELTLSATAPLSPQWAAAAERALAGPLIEIYGCTEAGQVASRRTTAGDAWQTLGALRIQRGSAAQTSVPPKPTPASPAPDGCTSVDGAGRAENRAAGDDGLPFFVSGGHVAEPTALADMLELIDDRTFRLLGRANDLIHVAGKRSSLAHLNFHLNRIPGVEDGAFWLPDDVAEAVVRPVAFVVAPGLAVADIVAALRLHLEPAFVPRRVVAVDALPREATGKLTAGALSTFARRTLGEQRIAGPAVPAVPAAGAVTATETTTTASSATTASVLAPAAGPTKASAQERTSAEASAAAAQASTGPAQEAAASAPVEAPVPRHGPPTAALPAAGAAEAAAPYAATVVVDIPVDHPAFAGHFPGHPVLPGVVLLSLALQALAGDARLAGRVGPTPRLDSAKFLAPVGPGARLTIGLKVHGAGVAFEVRQGDAPVARGQWSAAA